MKKIIFIIIFFITTTSLKAQTIVTEINGTDIYIKNAGSVKVGQTVEVTRQRRGNDMTTYTAWTINTSPVLSSNKAWGEEKTLAPCGECVLGQIVMHHEYARVKVKKVIK